MVAGSITFVFLKIQIRTTQISLPRANVMAANFDIGLIYCATGEVIKRRTLYWSSAFFIPGLWRFWHNMSRNWASNM